MAIITLTTDLGTSDYYVAAVKATILKQLPAVTIVDITHDIKKFDIQHAAFVLRNAYQSFPEGTVHIVGVNTETTVDTAHIGLKVSGHYFIGADNGVFSFIFDKVPDTIVELNIKQDTDVLTFPTRDVFCTAACHLARGGTLEVIGKRKDNIRKVIGSVPAYDKNSIRGSVAYVDTYGNVITNISRKIFYDVGRNRNFNILFKSYTGEKIHKSYSDMGQEGEIVALFNSSGLLEIAQYKANLGKLLSVRINEMLTIQFEE
jgi:S-adenosylmethionine hydrolase